MFYIGKGMCPVIASAAYGPMPDMSVHCVGGERPLTSTGSRRSGTGVRPREAGPDSNSSAFES